MIRFEDTKLEIFRLSDSEEDNFYSLTNIKKNPNGLDAERLAKTSPMAFDETLHAMGCILLMNHQDVENLKSNEGLTERNLHEGLFRLAQQEGILNH